MTPKLRFPGFTDEWQVKKLGDFAKVYDGTHQTPTYVKAGVPFYSVEQVTANDFKNTKYVAENIYLAEKIKPEKGDILMTRIGDIGTARYIDWDVRASYYVSLALIKQSDKYNGKFLERYIATDEFQNELWQRTIHVAFPKKINLGEISNCVVKLPSNAEQEKIAGFLTVIDGRIALIDEKIGLLKQYKKGVMQKIFTQQIRFKDENGKDYPAWQEKKLGQLEVEKHIKLGRGEVISKIDIANNPGNYPIYSSSVKNEGLFGRYGKYMFDEELITWSVDGGGHFFYRPAGKFSVTNVSGWMRVLDSSLNCKFLALQLQSLHERLVFDYQTKAHPSVIRQLYKLQIPGVEEQKKIADFLTAIDDKVKAEEAKLAAAKKFKKSLLQRMFV